HSCAVPFACAALPPRLAISRCRVPSIDANPRRCFFIILSSLPGHVADRSFRCAPCKRQSNRASMRVQARGGERPTGRPEVAVETAERETILLEGPHEGVSAEAADDPPRALEQACERVSCDHGRSSLAPSRIGHPIVIARGRRSRCTTLAKRR